ncbi:hypothetical protein LC653_23725 [Nostoc sp. CHAB 5784]|uniref:hypothetical protein n=1 Tax=Nostoc mirabile TaxID=2907820 RepID=UPI001E48FD61|nr:hypothetical protein [Nostoc mirabile]MCC5666818.1 hypothetical protein [Nostoc mirabile CHAB5784]
MKQLFCKLCGFYICLRDLFSKPYLVINRRLSLKAKELQFLAGHSFHVKLTPMSNAVPVERGLYYLKIAVKRKVKHSPTFDS